MTQSGNRITPSKPVLTAIVVLIAMIFISIQVIIWGSIYSQYSRINKEIAAFGSEPVLGASIQDDATQSIEGQGEGRSGPITQLTSYSIVPLSTKLPILWLTVYSSEYLNAKGFFEDQDLQSVLDILTLAPGGHGIDYAILLTPAGAEAALQRGLPKGIAASESYPQRLSDMIHLNEIILITVTSSSGIDILSSQEEIKAKLSDIDVTFKDDYKYRMRLK